MSGKAKVAVAALNAIAKRASQLRDMMGKFRAWHSVREVSTAVVYSASKYRNNIMHAGLHV